MALLLSGKLWTCVFFFSLVSLAKNTKLIVVFQGELQILASMCLNISINVPKFINLTKRYFKGSGDFIAVFCVLRRTLVPGVSCVEAARCYYITLHVV